MGINKAFFLGGRRGTRTPENFVNITGKTKNVKMLEFPLNQPQTYYRYLCDLCPLAAFIFSDLNYEMSIFLSQNESTPKHFFFRKRALGINLGCNTRICLCTCKLGTEDRKYVIHFLLKSVFIFSIGGKKLMRSSWTRKGRCVMNEALLPQLPSKRRHLSKTTTQSHDS
jgi:hypothetical protein